MNKPKEKLSQIAKPRGLVGIIAARIMPLGHKAVYESAAAALNLQPEDDFLEVGFGSGLFIKWNASHVRSIAGLDLSEDMVKMAAYYNRERVKAGTADFRQGRASQLPWEDEKFSAAAVIGTFEYLPKPVESIKEIYRVLRSGGRAVISLGWNAEDGMDHTKHEKGGMRMYTEKQMQTMLQEAGFSKISFAYSKGFMMPRIIIARAVK